SWHPGTSSEGLRRKSIPPRSHSAQPTFPSQTRSRHALGTSPSCASWTARNPLKRKKRTGAPMMISAIRRGFNASGLDPVVRGFLRDLHVVDVALAQAGGGDADELRLGAQLLDVLAAAVPHPAAKAAHQLEDVHRQRALVRNPPLDALGDQLHVLG